ncbi:MAG: enterobactin exporter EntS [Firmicutes bacterium ADurb.Bin248]|nr:MAG: enterobactin exporter EntS [Firmicutes bacterium ADurb.Bin248]
MDAMEKKPLWTKNFTILTLGTVVSMLGNAVSGFAIGLLVLDYTGSTLLYAIFTVAYNLPKIIMPTLAGPYIDRFPRAKVIYSLDFISAALYLCIFAMLSFSLFNYAVLLVLCVVIGSIDSVYLVAYDSLYPTLISEGNFGKAYSISSMLYPLSAMMVPVAAWCYENIGLEPLFLFNAFTFLFAAIFETQIKADESHVLSEPKSYNLRRYADDFKDGLAYLKREKGLLFITAYFVVNTLIFNGTSTLVLPYFKQTEGLGVSIYTYVMGLSVVGRMIGGFVQYRHRYPTHLKFAIAFCVYVAISLIEASYLFLPVAVMMGMMFVSGLLGVTSYNIRISSTQNHVPNEMRGRYNGTFQMLTTLGGILGALLAGVLGDALPIRSVICGLGIAGAVCAIAIMLPGREHVKGIYNVEL